MRSSSVLRREDPTLCICRRHQLLRAKPALPVGGAPALVEGEGGALRTRTCVFTRRPCSPAPAARRLVCVGRLCEQKGQLLLVEAAQRLATQGIEFELVLAGDGELRAEIEALIKHHNLQDRVRITGWISGEQVRDEILAARALVLPSFAEGLPIVIMEAMALKRPVISTFVAGIPELVQPGEHGWLVPAGDVEALADVMRACLETPVETLVRMGEAAHKRVVERHSVDTEAGKLRKFFQTAIEGANA